MSSPGGDVAVVTASALFDTVCVSTAAAAETLLQENPGLLRARAWHGLTLLHRACVACGDVSVVATLLRLGADANASNDAGETPLHYAARAGRLRTVAALLRHGADVDATDAAGHACVHFAAQGGHVGVLAYLRDVHGADYAATSLALQTPLHVAAIHGHWTTAAFLLRRERCSVAQADIMGNTALHLAAIYGHLTICWQIVASRNGAACLTAVNGQNLTPLDLSRTGGGSARHKEVRHWLAALTARQQKRKRISAPRTSQYLNFLLPTVLFCLPPLLSSSLPAGSQPLLYVAVVVVLGYWIARQEHRLSHPSRLPNPARAGVFALGFCGNLVAYFCLLRPYNYLDWMTNWASWTALFVYVLSMVAFVAKEPGAQRYELEMAADGGRDWSAVLNGAANFCDECEVGRSLIQREGVRHCRMCGACYRHLQHHCVFLLRCITASNARHFLAVLLAVICGCVFYVINVVLTVVRFGRPADALWRLWLDDTLVVVVATLDVFGVLWCAILAHHQLNNPHDWPRKKASSSSVV